MTSGRVTTRISLQPSSSGPPKSSAVRSRGLQVGAGGAVVDDDALTDGVEEAAGSHREKRSGPPGTRPLRFGVLTASRVSRHRGAQLVLDQVSLSVGPRSRIGVVGPNGIGKSTLLRILAGLEAPDEGRVERAPATLTVGYLPQEPDARPGETLLALPRPADGRGRRPAPSSTA